MNKLFHRLNIVLQLLGPYLACFLITTHLDVLLLFLWGGVFNWQLQILFFPSIFESTQCLSMKRRLLNTIPRQQQSWQIRVMERPCGRGLD
jgi:hypothetical protein